jgi:hypothetical protein
MELDQDQIKDLSVHAVEQFINNKLPLEEGICKSASELELNSEQIRRVVEASNTIAYLKLQKEAEDKTFEFPVASYEGVMAKMCLPTKTAGVIVEDEVKNIPTQGVVKEAEFEPDLATTQAYARKEALKNHVNLEKIAVEKEGLCYALIDKTMQLQKDEWAMEKLAEVCDEDDFVKLSFLITGSTDVKLKEHVFVDKELNVARELVGLFKQAQELKAREETLQALDKKAFSLASGMGKAIGGTVGGAVAGGLLAAKKTVKSVAQKDLKTIGRAASTLGTGGAALLTEPAPKSNIWDNLHGSQKRF